MESELNRKIRELLEQFDITIDRSKVVGKWNLIGHLVNLVELESEKREKEVVRKIKSSVKEIAYECLYQEWVEVATPRNFEAGKINITAFDKRIDKYFSTLPIKEENK